jgi:hypothetical protein
MLAHKTVFLFAWGFCVGASGTHSLGASKSSQLTNPISWK